MTGVRLHHSASLVWKGEALIASFNGVIPVHRSGNDSTSWLLISARLGSEAQNSPILLKGHSTEKGYNKANKVEEFEEGGLVRLKIPVEDRCSADNKHIFCGVVEFNQYALQCQYGASGILLY